MLATIISPEPLVGNIACVSVCYTILLPNVTSNYIATFVICSYVDIFGVAIVQRINFEWW